MILSQQVFLMKNLQLRFEMMFMGGLHNPINRNALFPYPWEILFVIAGAKSNENRVQLMDTRNGVPKGVVRGLQLSPKI